MESWCSLVSWNVWVLLNGRMAGLGREIIKIIGRSPKQVTHLAGYETQSKKYLRCTKYCTNKLEALGPCSVRVPVCKSQVKQDIVCNWTSNGNSCFFLISSLSRIVIRSEITILNDWPNCYLVGIQTSKEKRKKKFCGLETKGCLKSGHLGRNEDQLRSPKVTRLRNDKEPSNSTQAPQLVISSAVSLAAALIRYK